MSGIAKKSITSSIDPSNLTETHGRGRGSTTFETAESDYVRANQASPSYFLFHASSSLSVGFAIGIGAMSYYLPDTITGPNRWLWALVVSVIITVSIFSFACLHLWRPVSSYWQKLKHPDSPYPFPKKTRDVGPLEYFVKKPLAFLWAGAFLALGLGAGTPDGEGKTGGIIVVVGLTVGYAAFILIINYLRRPKYDTTYRTLAKINGNDKHIKTGDIYTELQASAGVLATTINSLKVERYSAEFDKIYLITRAPLGVKAIQGQTPQFSFGTFSHLGPYENYSYIHFKLPKNTPQFLLDYDSTGALDVENFKHRLKSEQSYKLEGIYGTTTSLYAANPSITRYALYVFTPDVMQAIESITPQADIEAIGQDLFIFWKPSAEKTTERIEHEIQVLNTVGSSIYKNILAYSSTNTDDLSSEKLSLAPLGQATLAAKEALQAKTKIKWKRAQYKHFVNATLYLLLALFIGLVIYAVTFYEPDTSMPQFEQENLQEMKDEYYRMRLQEINSQSL